MRFSPNHPEYPLFSDIYIDESSQTNHRYLLLGCVILPTDRVPRFCETIEAARLPELPNGEMAWTKVSNTKLPAYKRVVDAFFDNANGIPNLHFHSLFVDTHKLNHKKFNMGSREIGFNKEIYQLMMKCRILYNSRLFHCYPDKRTTQSKTEDLRLVLNRGARKAGDKRDWPFRRVTFRDSAKTTCLQVTDILLGAVAFRLNCHHEAPNASAAKCDLSSHVLARAGVKNVLYGTARAGRFTIWPRQLQ